MSYLVQSFKKATFLTVSVALVLSAVPQELQAADGSSKRPSCARQKPKGAVYKRVFPMSGEQIDEMLQEDVVVRAQQLTQGKGGWTYRVKRDGRDVVITISAKVMSSDSNTGKAVFDALTARQAGFSRFVVPSMQDDYFADEREILPLTGKQLCALVMDKGQTVLIRGRGSKSDYLRHIGTGETFYLLPSVKQALSSDREVNPRTARQIMTQFFGMRIQVANQYIRKTLNLK